MNNILNIYMSKLKMSSWVSSLSVLGLGLSLGLTSCSDLFDVDSEHIIYADEDHLHNATDTIYSVTGILDKLQAIADRTVLLGEARGDLMDVTDVTSADLRDVAMFNIGDDNKYNCPRDYYAVINNCNYFIAEADTSLKDNRNQYLFKREYAVVKAIRAWTYLQLVTTYGKVPFVTEPILTKEAAEREYPQYGIQEVCNYFINEDHLMDLVDLSYPAYGDIKRIDSRLLFFPIYVVLGDMNLWAGNYLEAAKCYYNYLITRNGSNSSYPTGIHWTRWMDLNWTSVIAGLSLSDESYSSSGELITMIPGDSIQSEGNYSELRSIFNSSSDNSYEVSLVPSDGMIELSESQIYCQAYMASSEVQILYAPQDLTNNMSGDLRLWNYWTHSESAYMTNGTRINHYQKISKYTTGNVHVYRRMLVYLRLAEALNRAGYPLFAFKILQTGVDKNVVRREILPAYPNSADSANIAFFEFPTASNRFVVYDPTSSSSSNMLGIHSRGCGYTMYNEYYTMPYDTAIVAGADSAAQQIAYQVKAVEDLIMDEEALELAFEGYRYYDLLRVALRREKEEPDYLSKHIQNRRAGAGTDIQADLMNKQNWFLHWNGQIGY